MRTRSARLLRGLWWLLCGACALVWGYAAWRLAVRPGDCGPVEATLAAGGWGLSLVPVHVSEREPRRRRGRTTDLRPRRQPGGGSGARWQRGHQ